LGVPLLTIYYLIRRLYEIDDIYQIIIVSLAVIEAFAKKRKIMEKSKTMGKLIKENKELADLKNILIQEIDSNLLIITKTEFPKSKNFPNKFQKIKTKFFSLIKKKNLNLSISTSNEKIRPKTSEKPKFYLKEINEIAKKNLGEMNNFDDLRTFLNNLHWNPEINAEPLIKKLPESTQILDFTEPEKHKFSDILDLFFTNPRKIHLPSSVFNKKSEIKLYSLGQSLLFIEKTNTEEIFLYKISKEANNEILRNQKLNYALMNAQLLLFLVNDILDFSRNKNNSTLALNLTQFPLQRVLEEVFLMMNMDALNKGISLIIQNESLRNLSVGVGELKNLLRKLTELLKFRVYPLTL